MTLTIPGTPIAKKRPRFFRRGNFTGAYNDQETEEGRFLLLVRQQWKGEPITGPVVLQAIFYMPIPKSASKKAKAQMEAGIFPHTKKPDLDNLCKFVKDCLNGVGWRDDSQVVTLCAGKKYSHLPRTELKIEEAS